MVTPGKPRRPAAAAERLATGKPSRQKRAKPAVANREVPEAQDAIPRNAILLTDAYDQLVGLIADQPKSLPKFDEQWSEVLKKSRELEQTAGHDPETFDGEMEEFWHRRKEANLFLRLEIEAGNLVACIRDPKTGDVLRLRARDWISSQWEDYVPPGIWGDHIAGNIYDTPGPEGSVLGRKSRPVFFLLDDWNFWLRDRLQHTPIRKEELLKSKAKRWKRKKDAVIEAIIAIYSGPVPAGVHFTVSSQKIRNWLAENKRDPVADITIRRAIAEYEDMIKDEQN